MNDALSHDATDDWLIPLSRRGERSRLGLESRCMWLSCPSHVTAAGQILPKFNLADRQTPIRIMLDASATGRAIGEMRQFSNLRKSRPPNTSSMRSSSSATASISAISPSTYLS